MLAGFHSIVASWFEGRFGEPTPAQVAGWPAIQRGEDTLVAAPTGSGKTLAAFLACLDGLVREAIAGTLEDRTYAVYVSPLKALGNDIQKNLDAPLAEIRAAAAARGVTLPPIRTAVRTGDTPAAERQRMLRAPPHLLITTPESLYLLLTSDSGRAMLSRVSTVIVDEIHAVARDKRGAHLALSLERLDALTAARPVRIGLSATQRPIERIAAFLVGSRRVDEVGGPRCTIVDTGHRRALDLAVEVPPGELEAVASKEQWSDVLDRVATLVREHRTTLVFVNTRRQVERVAHALGQRLGEDVVAAHHGSMARATRLSAEERLKGGLLRVVVATASLELGIDVGTVDLVVQLETPRSFAVGLQRVGRAGHHRGAIPKGRLFPLTRDQLVECAALVRGIRRGELEETAIPPAPLDILAQQIVAMASCETLDEDALFDRCRGAHPYRDLARRDFDAVVTFLSEGVERRGGRGKLGAYLHRDGVNHRVKGRRGARLAAVTSGGAIPDTAQYSVVAEPEGVVVGSLDEDFAIESMAGDVFLLGNDAWRVRRVEASRVRVENAHGASPSVPFWNGEAPGRSRELSREVGLLRAEVERLLGDPPAAAAFLEEECSLPRAGAEMVVRYLAAAHAALGALPTQDVLVAERFFDEVGGMQLVVHAPFGARINRAFGLALRKRFCASFDFELQAAASDEGVLLSLGPQHSFPLEAVFEFLSPNTVEQVLTQTVLVAPMFGARWRWNATRALTILRMQSGKKTPPNILRMRAEDLLAAVFPGQVACREENPGPVEIPDHPLVNETMRDCLHEAMDTAGLREVVGRIRSGGMRLVVRDTPEPSPLSHEILSSNPYTYLDDAPLEERRARAVATRRSIDGADVRALGALDADAIREVAEQAFPDVRDADELHDALLTLVILPDALVVPSWAGWMRALQADRRVRRVAHEGRVWWCATERAAIVEALLGGDPAAHVHVVRGWMTCGGPTTVAALAARLALDAELVEQAMVRLEVDGMVLRGHFTEEAVRSGAREWCDRDRLAAIHRRTLGRLRQAIEPVPVATYLRFLLRWQHLAPGTQLHGGRGLQVVLEQLAGVQVAAGAWEAEVLMPRLPRYEPAHLDALCLGGEIVWGRLAWEQPSSSDLEEGKLSSHRRPSRATSIALVPRGDLAWWLDATRGALGPLPAEASRVLDLLDGRGALFVDEIERATGLAPADVDDASWSLVAAGAVTNDAFGAVRRLVATGPRRGHGAPRDGRWSILRRHELRSAPPERAAFAEQEPWVERVARAYLARYGVVVRDVLGREARVPPWRELLRVYHRLEARGEIRAGRFVSGPSGEQFALPEAVDALRAVRKLPAEGRERVTVAAVDPLNLVGLLTPGPRVPAIPGHRVVFVDGVPEVPAAATG